MEPQPSEAEALAICNAASWIAKHKPAFDAFVRDLCAIQYRGELVDDVNAKAVIETAQDYLPDVCAQIDRLYNQL